ncbi:MAG: tRNA lysidine(34) synthetase TilS [Spirochaetota bacterium]
MSSIEKVITGQVRETLKHYTRESDSFLLACSGGLDSVVLLDALSTNGDLQRRRVAIAYVNHRLRPYNETQPEQLFAHNLADTYGIECFVLDAGMGTITQLARDRQKGIEEAARVVRYRQLYHCLETQQFDWILTAHHADDVIETLIMRFFKGSGIEGLTGIRQVRRPLLRPLLEATKEQLRTYARARGLVFHEDSSNSLPIYERNRIRNELLPLLQRLYPGVKESLLHTAEKHLHVHQYLAQDKERSCSEVSWDGRRSCVDIETFTAVTPYERMEILYRMWNTIGNRQESLPYAVIRSLVNGDIELQRAKTLFEYHGALCYASDGFLFLEKLVVVARENHYLKVVSADAVPLFPGYALHVATASQIEKEGISIPERSEPPLVVRSYMAGDVLPLEGGKKNISKLFSDWKVPVPNRWMIPVLENKKGIIGVLGSVFGFQDRIAYEYITKKPEKKQVYTVYRIVSD